MPLFAVTYSRRVRQNHHVVFEAESIEHAQEMVMDGEIQDNVIDEDILSEDDLELVPATDGAKATVWPEETVPAAMYDRRVTELLDANNQYLERARAAERLLAEILRLAPIGPEWIERIGTALGRSDIGDSNA